MQRVCRALRAGARAFKDNEVPAVAGEEVRRNQEDNFKPHNGRINECIGVSAGLFFAWNWNSDGRNKQSALVEHQDGNNSSSGSNLRTSESKCPFNPLRNFVAYAQPFLASSVIPPSVRFNNPSRVTKTVLVKEGSIDVSPFLKESLFESDSEIGRSTSFCSEDEESIWDATELSDRKNVSIPEDSEVASLGKKWAGHFLTATGVVELLQNGKSGSVEPSKNGFKLLKIGEEWGSSRSLYNIGVFYDRDGDSEIAREYYQRASALGHPLATYNYAAMILEKGKPMSQEVKDLMSYAYEHGVPEAKKYALQ